MVRLVRVLQVIRLLDENKNISLTNIALIAALVRLLCMPHLDVQSLCAFLTTVVGYQFKRWVQPNAPQDDQQELKAAIASLQTKVSALTMGQRVRP